MAKIPPAMWEDPDAFVPDEATREDGDDRHDEPAEREEEGGDTEGDPLD